MANFRSLPFSIVSLLLLASLIMADGGGGEGQQAEAELLAECRSLDPCRAGVSNDKCCRAIADGINTQGCDCVCKQLIKYGAAALTTACYKSSRCAKCKQCVCSTNRSGGPSANYDRSSKLVCSANACELRDASCVSCSCS